MTTEIADKPKLEQEPLEIIGYSKIDENSALHLLVLEAEQRGLITVFRTEGSDVLTEFGPRNVYVPEGGVTYASTKAVKQLLCGINYDGTYQAMRFAHTPQWLADKDLMALFLADSDIDVETRKKLMVTYWTKRAEYADYCLTEARKFNAALRVTDSEYETRLKKVAKNSRRNAKRLNAPPISLEEMRQVVSHILDKRIGRASFR